MSGEKTWYLLINGANDGPHAEEEIIRRIQAGEVGPQTQAYGPGSDSWRTLAEIPHFAQASGQGPAAPPQPPPITAGSAGLVHAPAVSNSSTLQLRLEKASEYSRVNFLLRLFGVYYILYLAHFFLWVGYSYAACVIFVLDMILAIITGRHHAGLVAYLQRFLRFNVRMMASAMGLTEEIPHIDINARRDDFPVDVTLDPDMEISRGAVILRLSGVIGILLIPHLLALGILGLAFYLAFFVGFLAVLFTGTWPDAIWNFLVGFIRWQLRVVEYVYGLSPDYPSFGLK